MTLPPWHAEIVELHEFFQGWLGGALPATDAAYARLTDTQAPEFVIVTPGGERIPGPTLLAQLRAAHASRPGIKKRKAQSVKRKTAGQSGAGSGRSTLCALRLNVFVETWLPEAVQRSGAQEGGDA